MWFENYVRCDLKTMFITISMYFSTIAKTIWCCDKLWFLGVSIMTRSNLQRYIVIRLNLAIYCKSWWYTLQTYLRMDSVRTIKNDGFLRLIVLTIVKVKITSSNKEIYIVYNLTYQNWLENSTYTSYYGEITFRFHVLSSHSVVLGHLWREMMSLHHGWGWQPPQTAFRIRIRHIQSFWAHSYAVHGHKVASIHRYPHYFAQILGFCVTCGVKMMSLHHGLGWQPPQTTSHIHIRNIYKVFEHIHMLSMGTWQ